MKEIGMRMRRSADDWGSFCCVAYILGQVEDRFGVTIPDPPWDSEGHWTGLTLLDLAVTVRHAVPSYSSAQVDEAILSAVRIEFPGAPDLLDYTLPLLDAICPKRYSHDFWGRPHELKI